MSTAGSWSVKGIDPEARDIARDLARRSGLTLGEWLNQMIRDTGETPPEAHERPTAHAPAPDFPPRGGETARRPLAAAPPPAAPEVGASPSGASVLRADALRSRLREAGRGADGGEAGRVTRALSDLTARLEQAEHRSSLAINGIDRQAAGVLARLEGVEADADVHADRLDAALDEVRDAQARVADRLAQLEGDDAPRVEALKALEGALGRVAAQLQEGETRARAQAVETREDMTALGRRVDRVEARPEAGSMINPVEAALARLAERVDRLDAVPAVDIAPLDAAYGRLAHRVEEDRLRTTASVRALETAFDDLGARVERVESAPSHEDALANLARRLDEAQARTTASVRALEGSFAGLDARLARAEAPADPAPPAADADAAESAGRLERLAAELHAKVDDARADMAVRLRDAADGKLDRMEAAVRDLSEQVAQSEHRSADAIDRMGREVVRIAHGLDGRVGEVERRGDARAAQMGGEMARIADAVENRLSRADGAQAEALEKLGGEIARIAEKLADRIAASEHRNAQDLTHGLDEVSEQLQRATDKLNTRYDTAAGDLAERIRASEERTHRLLADARERAEAAAPPPAAAAAPEPAAGPDPRFSPLADEPAGFAGAPRREAEAEEPFSSGLFESAPDDLDPFGAFDHAEPVHAQPEPADAFAPAARGTAPYEDGFSEVFALGSTPGSGEEPAPTRPGSTRQLIEQARAAARASAERNRRPAARGAAPAAAAELFSTPAPGFETEAPGALRSRFALPKLRRRESGTAKTALYATGVAVPLSVALVGAALMVGEGRHGGASVEAPSAAPPLAAAAPASPPVLAVAQTAPEPVSAAEAEPVPALAPAPRAPMRAAAEPAAASGRALYNEAVRELERGDRGGAETLKRAANLGYAPAQFHLGKLYEDGANGVGKDLVQARRWTERAAKGGDPKAMFNYGLYLANGEGVARDDKSAVDWFRRAADTGVTDAQFNLAVMTQQGRGAPANTADAYKWYLIAAADGDAGARQGAQALKPQLSADAQAAAERSAAAYHAQMAAAAASTQVRTASN